MSHPPITQSINRKYWENFSEEELEDYVEHLFREAREYGFPYHQLKPAHKKELEKLRQKDYLKFIEDGKINQHMGGLGFLWSFFPHAWEVKCGNGKTPMENFLDDDSLKKVIRKRLASSWAGNFSLSMLYKSLRMFNGAQSVSNFRPTSAAAIYSYVSKKYFDGRDLRVLDTSAGWGGRMLGAWLSDKVYYYAGIEPSKKSFRGLQDVTAYICKNFRFMSTRLSIAGSETSFLEDDDVKFDFIFTSPPYYDTEKYSNEPSQSWMKYETYDEWLNGFMRKTCENIKSVCHSKSVVAWNVANTKTAPNLVKDVNNIMLELGFYRAEQLDYLMSGRPQNSKYKFEPVLFYSL